MEENKMEIFHELIKREPNILSLPIEQLAPISYVGHEAVKYAIGINKKLDKLPLTLQQKERWLADAQDMGDIVIDIEAHIGELLPPPEETRARLSSENKGFPRKPLSITPLPNGITKNKAFIARQIKNNPDIVKEVKREAREIEDIPTKTAVLSKIHYKKELERQAKIQTKTIIELSGEGLIYKNKLLRIINILPAYPPKELTEQDYKELSALVQIIIKRLEVFQNGKEKESLRIGST